MLQLFAGLQSWRRRGIGITADSEHFLIANYHSINDCRYVIGVYRVLIFYLK
jgi:hypothetical protein